MLIAVDAAIYGMGTLIIGLGPRCPLVQHRDGVDIGVAQLKLERHVLPCQLAQIAAAFPTHLRSCRVRGQWHRSRKRQIGLADDSDAHAAARASDIKRERKCMPARNWHLKNKMSSAANRDEAVMAQRG